MSQGNDSTMISRLESVHDGTSAGFVAGSAPKLASVIQKRYQPVGSDDDDDDGPSGRTSNKAGAVQESFEVELLGDIEGTTGELSERRGGFKDDDDEREDQSWMSNIWSPPNRAVVMSYFCVGFSMRFLFTPMTYYMINLGAQPGEQNVVFVLASLPWSFKLVYGFISDNFPLWGMRRKPYFIIGWATFTTMNLCVAVNKQPSVQLLAAALFISTGGFMFSDVTTDAILVERSKREPRETRGSMQAVGYSVRFAGSLLGSMLGMAAYNEDDWWGFRWSIQRCFLLNGLFPLFVIGPFVWHLSDKAGTSTSTLAVGERLKAQSLEVFKTLEQKAVFVPMGVVFLYNLLQVPNAAWRSFLVLGLHFNVNKLGVLGIVASLMASAGIMAYKRWLFHMSWRTIYVCAALVVMFFSLLQLLLIFRINVKLGISDFAFSVGDDSIQDFVTSIQFLPIVQMYIAMCPDGAEGTTYAILTTMSNVAGAASMTLSTLLTKIWDVSNESLEDGNFSGMWKYTLFTCLVQPVPLLLIRWLPGSQAEQRVLQSSGVRHAEGGIVLLVVLFSSLSITIIQSIVELSLG